MSKKVLFLTLRTFSFTGGIEKVCRVFTRTLYDMSVNDLVEPRSYSMYDKTSDRDAKYILKGQFKGFFKRRISFSIAAVAEGIRSQTVILSHINLLIFALLIKRLSPKTNIVLIVHGIEVWRDIKDWKARFLRNHCDEIWAVSAYTANKMQELHQVPAERIKVVHNCLDPFLEIPDSFKKPEDLLKRYKLKETNPIIFTLTRLSSTELYKGYDLVIQAMPRLLETYPNLKYLIAGKADFSERNRLIQLIKLHRLEHCVYLVGFIPDEELSEHFLLADAFIMPSRKEGFGIVFIEAAACGCKTIGGNQDGSVDALLNGKLGTLVNPTDIDAICEAVETNLNTARTVESSQAIQNLCMEHFSYTVYYKRIKELIGG